MTPFAGVLTAVFFLLLFFSEVISFFLRVLAGLVLSIVDSAPVDGSVVELFPAPTTTAMSGMTMINQHVNIMNLHTPRVRRRWWPMFLNWLLVRMLLLLVLLLVLLLLLLLLCV